MSPRVSNQPWSDITAGSYSEAGAYCDACLVNSNSGPRAQWTKDNCHLPVRDPSGAVNRNALSAAAAALAGARGGITSITSTQKTRAARALIRLYNTAGMSPPDSLKQRASQQTASETMDTAIRKRAGR